MGEDGVIFVAPMNVHFTLTFSPLARVAKGLFFAVVTSRDHGFYFKNRCRSERLKA